MLSYCYRFCIYALAPLLLVLFIRITPSQARECLDCHAETLGQLKSNSHHIQGVEPNSRHCYACHWESTVTGEIDERYHSKKDAQVDLVIWQDGTRPAEHLTGGTSFAFRPAAMGTEREREAVAGISSHCLSCHNDATSRSATFVGDLNTPAKYAWDGESIDSRYSRKETTTWGKYSTAATNKKQRIIKALSPHGNAVANQGGWQKEIGYDGDMPLSRGGSSARNVECYDCHNSHGSSISGVTSSYRSSDGTSNGGVLKETFSGKGGYRMSYRPSVNTYANSKNPFNAGAGLCFDCHETPREGTTPWGYSSTFGASQPIMGYKDTPGFGPGSKGSTARFANRQGREEIRSSHLKGENPLEKTATGQINGLCTPCHDPHGISRTLGAKAPYAVPLLKDSWLTSPYREDGPPAGLPGKGGSARPMVTTTAEKSDFNSVNREANSNFAKGDSAPPRQADFNTVNREANANFGKGSSDAAKEGSDYNRVNREANSNFAKGESAPPGQADFNAVNREANANFGKGTSGAAQANYNTVNRDTNANFGKGVSKPAKEFDANTTNRDTGSNFGKSGSGAPREPMQGMKYNVDRNTFTANNRISENEDTFAGLCLKCHTREALVGDSGSGLIHRAVKGWGNNKEHSFPCSKCHQAHNSGLPRLMQTNCFELGPSGLRENSGLSWLPYKSNEPNKPGGSKVGKGSSSTKNKVVGCHVRQFGKATTSSLDQNNNKWQVVNRW